MCMQITEDQNTVLNHRYICMTHFIFKSIVAMHPCTTLLTVHPEDSLCCASWLPSTVDSAQYIIIIIIWTIWITSKPNRQLVWLLCFNARHKCICSWPFWNFIATANFLVAEVIHWTCIISQASYGQEMSRVRRGGDSIALVLESQAKRVVEERFRSACSTEMKEADWMPETWIPDCEFRLELTLWFFLWRAGLKQ